MTHKTKGIVLRTIKYGETSIIVSAYTELFGLQNYIVKGVRQTAKKSTQRGVFFQPGAILEMVVYHNPLKNLNFIKEYSWSYIYHSVFFDVVKNTVAVYMIELLQHSIKQPEANTELFYLIQDGLQQLDKGSPIFTANLPLYFSIHLSSELGFRIQGKYSSQTPILDLQEGMFVKDSPNHNFYVENELAKATHQLLMVHFYNELEHLHFERSLRQELIRIYQNYIALHVADFGEIKTLTVLQQIFQ